MTPSRGSRRQAFRETVKPDATSHGMSFFGGLIDLGSEVGGGRSGIGEVTAEDGLDEVAEDNLGTAGLWKSKPQNEDEFEGVIEWKPVDGVDGALKNSQESIYDPIS